MTAIDFDQILQYRITHKSLFACLNYIQKGLNADVQGRTFVCANPHSLVTADDDPDFQKVFQHADLVTPDGIGIVYASKILGGSIKQRITGFDIFQGLSKLLNEKEGESRSYFFLGSTEETLKKIQQKLAVDYPNITFAGAYSPSYKPVFSEDDNRAMIEAVNAVKPDVLWVGMTAPKQEKWIYQNRDKLDVKFIGAIGAVFDFYVGNVKRSHPLFLKFGLEWLPRLLQEPRRLWRRNFISSPKFMYRVICQKINGGKS